MKKRSLTTAVLAGLVGVAGFAGTASAVSLNPDGTGQALIYPYYTVRAGQQTYISVVNTTDTVQAVKVRFLEGYASKEVLDFNLFLSPYDVWTGTIFKLSDAGLSGAGAAVGTRDHSCTVPNIYNGNSYLAGADLYYQPFTNLYYRDDSPYSDDKGPSGTDRTNEGYIELIAMATVGDANGTATNVTHVPTEMNGSGLPVAGSGVPADCTAGPLNSIANTDLTTAAPMGGLFGNAAIVNTTNGTYYSYAADAIQGFTVSNLFSQSGSLGPNLASANTDPVTGEATAYVVNGTSLISATYPATNPVNAVSAVFMASAIMNEWIADAAAGQGTDWVVTFPTKRFYVNLPAGTPAIPPFTQALDEVHAGAACERVGLEIWDREEGTAQQLPGGPVFSPAPVIQTVYPNLCHEVNVITVSDPENPVSILGSQYKNGLGGMGLAVNVPPYGSAGWMRISFTAGSGHALPIPGTGNMFEGLPATGFAAQRMATGSSGSILANYSGAFHHRVERTITSAAPPVP